MTVPPTSRPHALVVAYDFPPHGAIGTMRTLRVVRELDARGWRVTVLTGDPATYLPNTPVDLALLDRVPSGVRIIRAGAIRTYSRLEQMLRGPVRARTTHSSNAGGGKSRRRGLLAPLVRAKDLFDAALAIPDRQLAWLLPALTRGAVDCLRNDRPDVVYSSAPPWTGQLVAAGLRAVLGRPWVADFRDPWARAPWREDRYPFAMRAAAAMERYVISHADHVLFVARGNRDDFAAQYGPAIARKLHLIPNGCDPSEFDRLSPAAPADGPFVLLHAGSLYGGRTPITLFHAIAAAVARGVIDPARFRLRFIGTISLQGEDLAAVARRLGLEQIVELLPRVPRDASLRAMMSASALLLLQPGHAVSVPGKFYEYLAAGRPILAIADEGETADLVRQSGIGIAVPPDEAKLGAALASIVQMASAHVTPPRRELYDGNARAAETVQVLESVVRGEDVLVRTPPAPRTL